MTSRWDSLQIDSALEIAEKMVDLSHRCKPRRCRGRGHNSQSTLNSHCSQKDIVYSIKCDLCHDNDAVYIGETSRPFSQRFQEHYRSAANPTAKSYKNMAFSKHYKTCHEGQTPKLTAKILQKTNGSLERKVTEAVLIQKLKPDLNGQVNIVDFLI